MSKSVFIILNQDNHYLDTEDQWAAPGGEQLPFFTAHKDVSINKLFEMTLADAALRGKVVACPADDRGKPLLDIDYLADNALPETAADPETTTASEV